MIRNRVPPEGLAAGDALLNQIPGQRVHKLWLVVLLTFCLTYVLAALTPSSYGAAFGLLGLEPSGLLLGTPRPVRSDEWIVLTPYFQIAVANGLDVVNKLSPYQETLRSFQALPLLDWGMLFKPYHWGFLILPAANAFSLYYLCMVLAFVGGWALFLCALRMPAGMAVVVAIGLLMSPFVQVWWSSNAGAFALAPWAAVAWLGIDNRALRILASTYALAVWALSCAYPPFLYSILLAMLVLVLAFRRDRLSLARIVDATIAGSVALAIFIGYFHELIEMMQNTVYPGQRISGAGGQPWAKLFAQLVPGLTTRGYEPFQVFASNACEIAVLSSWLPAYALTLTDHRALRARLGMNWPGLVVLVAGIGFMVAWCFLPLPAAVGKYTGLFMVPPGRALLALGLMLNVAAAIMLLRGGVVLTPVRFIALAAMIIGGALGKLAYGHDGWHGLYGAMDLVPFAGLLVLVLVPRCFRQAGNRLLAVLAVATLANVATYGLFNPVQSARPIFSLDTARIRQTMLDRGAQVAPDGTMMVPGHYGALLTGAGLPTINHVLYHPELSFFRKHFPDLPADEFNTVFNRYAHVVVEGDKPVVMQADLIRVPARAFLPR